MILHGHVIDKLAELPDKSVHMVMTSPPYYALRNYKTPEQTWPDGWVGHLGLEPTPVQYLTHMVDVFRAVWRVLRDDGTVWLNIGDCYANDTKWGGATSGLHVKALHGGDVGRRKRLTGLKAKELMGIPWSLAFALSDDGWYVRGEIVWAKGVSFCETWAGSIMPESVTDRPHRSHEQLFLLTKSPTYFYDAWAVKEKGVYPAGTKAAKGSGTREGNRRPAEYAEYDGTRNLRTVWAIGTEPFEDAHFATFPPDLVHPCVAAGTSAKGVCPHCSAPWERVVELEPIPEHIKAEFEAARKQTADDHGRSDGFTTRRPNYTRKVIGESWKAGCDCLLNEPIPATVVDCFAGSGTVGVVCEKMQRRFIGIELSDEYVTLQEKRLREEGTPLFSSLLGSES